jgi:hypothetical protein
MPKGQLAPARWWAKVRFERSGCWEWQGAKTRGYGNFYDEHGETVYAYRWSYERYRGPIPDGLTIDHLCRNPLCVNPLHMEPVTLGENVRRAMAVRPKPTHCPSGHAYTEENTRYNRRGDGSYFMACRICSNLRGRESKRRARELVRAQRQTISDHNTAKAV